MKILEIMIFLRKMKVPQTVPRTFRTTQGMPTGPETTTTAAHSLLMDLLLSFHEAGAAVALVFGAVRVP